MGLRRNALTPWPAAQVAPPTTIPWERAAQGSLLLLAMLFSAGYSIYGAAVVLIVGGLEVLVRRRSPWVRSPLDPTLALFVAAFVISGLLSEFRPEALSAAAQGVVAIGLGVMAAFRVLRGRPMALRSLGAAWTAGGVVAAGLGLYAYVAFPPDVLGSGARTYTLVHSALGTTMVIASLISLGYSLSHRGWARALGIVGTVLATTTLIATSSRGAWLGWIAGIVVFVALVLWHRRRKALWMLAALVLLAGTLVALQPGALTRLIAIRGGSIPTRLSLWRAALGMLWHHPWFGVGPGAFGGAYARYVPPDAPHREDNPQFAHNLYLNAFVEAGLIGGVALIAVIITALRIGGRYALRVDDPAFFGFLAGYVGLLAREFFDGTIWAVYLGVGFAVLLGIMAASGTWMPAARPAAGTPPTRL